MSLNKNIKLIINYVVGPTLLILISYHLYHEFSSSPQLSFDRDAIQYNIRKNGLIFPVVSLVLMLLQWTIEALKWRIIFKTVHFQMKWATSLKMIFAGSSFSFVTPNRMGEFIGRVVYLPSEMKGIGTAFTVYNSIVQISVYCFFASIAFYFYDVSLFSEKLSTSNAGWIDMLKMFTALIALACVVFFFFQKRFFTFLYNARILKKFTNIWRDSMQLTHGTSVGMLGLTILKTMMVILQYWLVFSWLGVEISFISTFAAVSLMMFGLVVFPTISFIEIGLRWEFSYLLFSVYTSNLLGITIGASIIWLLNIVLPAIIGAFWLIFRPIHRHDP